MVDTTDSKSVASNRVRVQVSSPVSKNFLCKGSSFVLTTYNSGGRVAQSLWKSTASAM